MLCGSTGELSLVRCRPRHPHVQTRFCSSESWVNPITTAADWSSFPLAVLSLPLTCEDISHQIRLKSGKYGGYAVISSSNSMEILTVGEWDWEQLAFPMSHFSFTRLLSLWPLCSASLSSSSSLLFAAWIFSFCFLPARCLTKPFSLFQILPLFLPLFCAALPHFLSLSANSRCLIHQHLLKL